jgi:hypothetical protein
MKKVRQAHAKDPANIVETFFFFVSLHRHLALNERKAANAWPGTRYIGFPAMLIKLI